MDDLKLIQKSIEGDYQSFNELVSPYINQAHKTASLILNDSNLAEDAVQEALYQAYISLKRYDSSKALFKTWFNRVVVNCTLKMKRNIFSFLEFKTEKYNKTDISPEDKYVTSEENVIIYNAIQKLTIKLRTVLVLHYFQELSIQEISITLDISEGTVKSRLHKARKNMEKFLQEDENFH